MRRTGEDYDEGVQTTLPFQQEGLYHIAVETMSIDFVRREKAPFGITLPGTQLPHYLHRRKYEEAKSGWYYSQTKKSVQIKYRNPKDTQCGCWYWRTQP
ncbi:hypothetical protein [Hungatella hathewayi]|uniref:hypothetical protein n=1 Tax=Hungatella hathewayi TaxID=154046 RepID=UPI0035668B50